MFLFHAGGADVLGARLIERLVLLNTIRVRSWKIYDNATTYGIRDTLITVRKMDVRNVILFAHRTLAIRVLDGVSVYEVSTSL